MAISCLVSEWEQVPSGPSQGLSSGPSLGLLLGFAVSLDRLLSVAISILSLGENREPPVPLINLPFPKHENEDISIYAI